MSLNLCQIICLIVSICSSSPSSQLPDQSLQVPKNTLCSLPPIVRTKPSTPHTQSCLYVGLYCTPPMTLCNLHAKIM